jgi:hypothetical protein
MRLTAGAFFMVRCGGIVLGKECQSVMSTAMSRRPARSDLPATDKDNIFYLMSGNKDLTM